MAVSAPEEEEDKTKQSERNKQANQSVIQRVTKTKAWTRNSRRCGLQPAKSYGYSSCSPRSVLTLTHVCGQLIFESTTESGLMLHTWIPFELEALVPDIDDVWMLQCQQETRDVKICVHAGQTAIPRLQGWASICHPLHDGACVGFFFPFLFSSPVGDMSFKSALANGMWFSTLAELVLGELQLSWSYFTIFLG